MKTRATLAVMLVLTLPACWRDPSAAAAAPPPKPPTASAPAARAPEPRAPLTLASAQLAPGDLAPECQPSTVEAESFHARTLFESGLSIAGTERGKAKQSFLCGRVPATVYYFEMGSANEARSAAGYVQALLWGEASAPTAEHPEEVLRSGAVLAVVASRRPGPLVATLRERRGLERARLVEDVAQAPEPDADALARFRAVIDCASAAEGRYCRALDAFSAGDVAAPRPAARVGAVLRAEQGRPAGSPRAAREEVVGYLLAGTEGVLWGQITPDNASEAAQLQDALTTLRRGEAVAADGPVNRYAQTLTTRPRDPAVVIGRSRVVAGARMIWLRDTPTGTVMLITDRAASPRLLAVGIFPQ